MSKMTVITVLVTKLKNALQTLMLKQMDMVHSNGT